MRDDPGAESLELDELGGIGAYFAVRTGPGDVTGWRPLAELSAADGPLTEMIADIRRRLGGCETRVAASILFQGLASRLWSPVLAVAVLRDRALELDPDITRWHPVPSGPVPLWLPAPRARPGSTADLVGRAVLERHLLPLVTAIRARVRVAEGLLLDDAAAGLAGALAMLSRARPDIAVRARELVEALLDRPPLAGTGRLVRPDPRSDTRFFVRRACCLYYRVPGAGADAKCGDCALLDAADRERGWRAALAAERE